MAKQKEIVPGFEGFRAEDFTYECGGCGETKSSLENFVRASIQVERDIPNFEPADENDAKVRRLSAAEEGGMFCTFACLSAHAEKRQSEKGMRMFQQVEPEFPYGEDDESYQRRSEKHNRTLKKQREDG